MKKSIVILTGGGPAPGMNTVVGSIAKTFISNGYRVLGLHGGYKGLFSKEPNYTELDFLMADSIFNRGGSYLIMSRYKPSPTDFEQNFNLNFFIENNIQLGVNDLNSYFNSTDVVDIRKDAYPQIAKFYKMYFDDKKVISTTSEDIKIFQKQVDECRIGFKDKQNKLYQREQDLKARMQ